MTDPWSMRPISEKHSARAATAFGAYSAACGLVSLVGWAFDIRRLTSWDGSPISIQPNTALAATAAGVSVMLLAAGRPAGARAFAALPLLLGAATLAEHVLGLNFGVDSLIAFDRSWGQALTVAPGRMGPLACVSWLLLGAGACLASTSRRGFRRAAGAAATAAVLIAFLSIVGHLFGADPLFSLPRLTAMAFQTATMVLAVALGLACAVPEVEPLRTLLASGASGFIARRALPLVVLLPVLVGWLRILGEKLGLYERAFGTALRTVVEVVLMTAALWWFLRRLGMQESRIEESEELSTRVIESSRDCIKVLDLEGRLLSINGPGQAAFGITDLGSHLGRPWADLWSGEHRVAAVEALQKAARGSQATFEGFLATLKGEDKWWQVSINPVLDARGRPEKLLVVSRDITLQRRATEALECSEKELRHQAAQLSSFLETAAICLHRAGPDRKILWANDAELRAFGYSREEYVGHDLAEFHADQEVIADVFARLNRGEAVRDQEARVRCKDGSIKRVLIDTSVLREGGRFVHTQSFTRDISERTRLDATRAMLASIVQASDDAIVSKTLQGVITSWNSGAERLFGYTAAEAVGQSIMMLIPPGLRDEEQSILAKLRKGEHIEHYETTRITKNGRAVDVSLSISPIRDAAGRVIGASKIARNITERRRADEEREALLLSERHARSEAERLDRVKEEFLATLSHELRTPLNAIVGWVQVLRRRTPTPEMLEQALSVLERNARIQTQIIADLLDMSRIVSGKMRLEVQRVDLPLVIQAALDAVTPAAEAKGVRLQTVLESIAEPVHGDAGRLQQVVWNLLSNAVKFTPRGGRVQVILSRVDSQVEITVSDTGNGIGPEFLPYVFERFRQADSSASREYGGLGLGLAIVKQLTELHGGSVSAASDGPGLGATFRVSLPLAVVREAPSRAERSHPTAPRFEGRKWDSPDLRGATVLVVDDEPDARELIRRVLEECGAKVVLAASAPDALAALASGGVDVILSDIGMPENDGYRFMTDVRRRGIRTPAAALTAFARSEDRTRALNSGYQTHIAKPVEPSELVAAVAALANKAPWGAEP